MLSGRDWLPSLSFLNSFLYSDFYMGYFATTSLAGSLMFKVKLDAISLERFFGAQFPNRITSLPHGFCPLITTYLSRSSLYFKFFVGEAHGFPRVQPCCRRCPDHQHRRVGGGAVEKALGCPVHTDEAQDTVLSRMGVEGKPGYPFL